MMTRSSSFIPYPQGTQQKRTAQGAADFLRANDKMAAIMPTVTRLAALQKDCAATLPTMFDSCSVLSFEADQLVLAIPNAAIASKLKQQLPKLQDNLRKRGWQVIAIRLKVQLIQEINKTKTPKQLSLPTHAISALAALENTLEDTPTNSALKAALGAMLKRHHENT
jgi:hypothetical protein